MEKSKVKAVTGLYFPTDRDRELFSKLSIVILTPCASYDHAAKFTKFVTNMVCYSWMHGLPIYAMGITERTVVDWARNTLADNAREHVNEYTGERFTHILWLDDDHTFPPDLAVRLAARDVDMASALYYSRTSPHYPVVYVKDPNEDYKHFPLIEVPPAFFEADAVGFGALLMRRDVLDRVPKPWFTIDWRAGEDIAFCVKAKEHGIKIWCDGGYKLGHIGLPPVITEADWLKAKAADPDRFKDPVLIELGQGYGKKHVA